MLIQQRTGHASVESLCTYERPSVEQRTVSRVMSSTEKFDYEKEDITCKVKRHCTKLKGGECLGALNLKSNQNCTININLSYQTVSVHALLLY